MWTDTLILWTMNGPGLKNTAIFLTKENSVGLLFFSRLLTLHMTPIIYRRVPQPSDLTTIRRDTFYKRRNWELEILITLKVIQPEFDWYLNPRSLTQNKSSCWVVSCMSEGENVARFSHSRIYFTVPNWLFLPYLESFQLLGILTFGLASKNLQSSNKKYFSDY